ncbi:MAG: hypothetical protein II622_07690, partial [Thermoguttaceae bacterium]|nr:hypothetical protein [Thermoguttaceae bacterium]
MRVGELFSSLFAILKSRSLKLFEIVVFTSFSVMTNQEQLINDLPTQYDHIAAQERQMKFWEEKGVLVKKTDGYTLA